MEKPDLPWAEGAWQELPGEGWWPIIARLDQDLRKVAPDYQVLQVKEKFGGLRYYTTFPNANYLEIKDQVEPLMHSAQAEAERTCEVCGQPGTLRTERWHKTLCDADEVKRQERYAQMREGL